MELVETYYSESYRYCQISLAAYKCIPRLFLFLQKKVITPERREFESKREKERGTLLHSYFSELIRIRTDNSVSIKKKKKELHKDVYKVQSEREINSAEEGALGIFYVILGIIRFMKGVCLIKLRYQTIPFLHMSWWSILLHHSIGRNAYLKG